MGLQMIFCVEANKKSKSDYIYIKNTIENFYSLDGAHVKLTPYYLNGKGNYGLPKTERAIETLQKQYTAGNRDNKSQVLFCFDCDDYDKNSEDLCFLKDAYDYCNQNGYEYIWFCKEIESVYLGRQIPDSQKKQEAEAFAIKKIIHDITINNLVANCYHDGRSNICRVLDKYLKRKQN